MATISKAMNEFFRMQRRELRKAVDRKSRNRGVTSLSGILSKEATVDQPTLASLQDGLRHIKGLVGALDRWIDLQSGGALFSREGGSEKKL